jgi:hypothetical protein
MAEYDDPELERLVRGSLDTHAGEVDTTVPVAARARAAARPRRGRWIAAGAAVAVAAAIAAVTVPVLVVDHQEPESNVVGDVGLPTQWRTEYWHDISVEVPADWGWGVTPTRVGDQLVRCGDGGGAYVGRPIATSDLCAEARGAGPYVWFDSPLEPGVDGDQETVEVDGERVTVATDGAVLRERIVSSIATQHLCPESTPAAGPDLGGLSEEGLGKLQTFTLCAYSWSEAGADELVYGTPLDPATYGRWRRATRDLQPVDHDCPAVTERVVLTATFDDPYGVDPLFLTWVVDLSCGLVTSNFGDGALTSGLEDMWADAGLRSTLSYFIGPLG